MKPRAFVGKSGQGRFVRRERKTARIAALFDKDGLQDADIGDRPVGVIRRCGLDAPDYVHAFNHLSEYGIAAVQARHASDGGIGFDLRLGKTERRCGGGGGGVHAVFQFGQFLPGIGLAGDDVEMAARGAAFRVDVIALPCGGQGAPLVKQCGSDFGRQRIAHIGGPQCRGVAGVFAGRIARLDHKLPDDPVKQHAVIDVVVDQFEKIVAVYGGFVIQFDRDVTQRCFDAHPGSLIRLGTAGAGGQPGDEKESDPEFVHVRLIFNGRVKDFGERRINVDGGVVGPACRSRRFFLPLRRSERERNLVRRNSRCPAPMPTN